MRTARILMIIAAISAAVAAISDISTVTQAPTSTLVVQTWRLCGFGLFTGLFVLLAIRPRPQRGLWEITIANKLVLTLIGACFAIYGGIAETSSILVWDGLLTVLLIIGYVAAKGWHGIKPAG